MSNQPRPQPPVLLDTQDMARLLVVPNLRKPPTPQELSAFHARLAPIEMSAPSLHLQQHPSAKTVVLPRQKPEPAQPERQGREIHLSYGLPSLYAGCGLSLALCALLVPGLAPACTHVLCPWLTVAICLHALADGSPPWMGLGFLCAVGLPLVALFQHPLLVGLYLLVFAVFVSGRFWRALQGALFVLNSACLLGLLVALSLALFVDHPWAHLSVAGLFALGAAIVSSAARFTGLRLAIV